eukprot:1151969-Pelagomonas_calceolata.AAC.1
MFTLPGGKGGNRGMGGRGGWRQLPPLPGLLAYRQTLVRTVSQTTDFNELCANLICLTPPNYPTLYRML